MIKELNSINGELKLERGFSNNAVKTYDLYFTNSENLTSKFLLSISTSDFSCYGKIKKYGVRSNSSEILEIWNNKELEDEIYIISEDTLKGMLKQIASIIDSY